MVFSQNKKKTIYQQWPAVDLVKVLHSSWMTGFDLIPGLSSCGWSQAMTLWTRTCLKASAYTREAALRCANSPSLNPWTSPSVHPSLESLRQIKSARSPKIGRTGRIAADFSAYFSLAAAPCWAQGNRHRAFWSSRQLCSAFPAQGRRCLRGCPGGKWSVVRDFSLFLWLMAWSLLMELMLFLHSSSVLSGQSL